MAARLVLLILGAFHIVNGLFMLFAPGAWYVAVPGVVQSGPMNHHFIADIGLAFLASGTGLIYGIRRGAAAFAVAGAAWPALHALLHIRGWVQHGFPTVLNVALSDTVGVVLVGVLGVIAAWMKSRKEGVFG